MYAPISTCITARDKLFIYFIIFFCGRNVHHEPHYVYIADTTRKTLGRSVIIIIQLKYDATRRPRTPYIIARTLNDLTRVVGDIVTTFYS